MVGIGILVEHPSLMLQTGNSSYTKSKAIGHLLTKVFILKDPVFIMTSLVLRF